MKYIILFKEGRLFQDNRLEMIVRLSNQDLRQFGINGSNFSFGEDKF